MAVQSALSGPTETVDADFTSVDNNLNPRFGIVLRYQNPTNYYLIYRQTGGASRCSSPGSSTASRRSWPLSGSPTRQARLLPHPARASGTRCRWTSTA
jgi:hypothetical protein